MTWAKIDDRFYSNLKVLRAWKLSRASVGLHMMAIAWCCAHEKDGHVPEEFAESVLPKDRERVGAVTALLDAGLWHQNGEGWVIHDFLEYNPSAASLQERRRREAERKATARASRSVRTDEEAA